MATDLPDSELEAVDLVFIGSFQPGIIQPSWLARKGLISDSEADGAEISIISNEVSQFSTEWFTLEVIAERLRVLTQLDAFRLPLRDLAIGVLASLPNSTVTAFGINHSAHFALENEDAWHRLGHKLAPKDLWGRFAKNPGTASLQVLGGRPDDRQGSLTYTFQPSRNVAHGIFLSSNDHFDLRNQSEKNAAEAGTLLNVCFEESIERSTTYFVEVLAFSKELKGGIV